MKIILPINILLCIFSAIYTMEEKNIIVTPTANTRKSNRDISKIRQKEYRDNYRHLARYAASLGLFELFYNAQQTPYRKQLKTYKGVCNTIAGIYEKTHVQGKFDFQHLSWKISKNQDPHSFADQETFLNFILPGEIVAHIKSSICLRKKHSYPRHLTWSSGNASFNSAPVSLRLLRNKHGIYPSIYRKFYDNNNVITLSRLDLIDTLLEQKFTVIQNNKKNPEAFELIDGTTSSNPIALGLSKIIYKGQLPEWVVALSHKRNSNHIDTSNTSEVIRLCGKGKLDNLSLFTKYMKENDTFLEKIFLITITDLNEIKIFNFKSYINEEGELGLKDSEILENSAHPIEIKLPSDLSGSKVNIIFAITEQTLAALIGKKMFFIALEIPENNDPVNYKFHHQQFTNFNSIKYMSKDPDDPSRIIILSTKGHIGLMSLHDRSFMFLMSDPLAQKVRINGNVIMIEQKHPLKPEEKSVIRYFDGNDLITHHFLTLPSFAPVQVEHVINNQEYPTFMKQATAFSKEKEKIKKEKEKLEDELETCKKQITNLENKLQLTNNMYCNLIKNIRTEQKEEKKIDKQNYKTSLKNKLQLKDQANNELCENIRAEEKEEKTKIRAEAEESEKLLVQNFAQFRRRTIRYGIIGGLCLLTTGGVIGYTIAQNKPPESFLEKASKIFFSTCAALGKIFYKTAA